MAEVIQVHGACQCRIQTAALAAGVLQTLGYTRNFAEIRTEAMFLDVPGDEGGGDDGIPIDLQYLGELAIIRLELTKYDATVSNAVRSRLDAITTGVNATIGALVLSATNTMRLLLKSPTLPFNFPLVVPNGAIEVGIGTKYSTLICEFTAYPDSNGLLFNAVDT